MTPSVTGTFTSSNGLGVVGLVVKGSWTPSGFNIADDAARMGREEAKANRKVELNILLIFLRVRRGGR